MVGLMSRRLEHRLELFFVSGEIAVARKALRLSEAISIGVHQRPFDIHTRTRNASFVPRHTAVEE